MIDCCSTSSSEYFAGSLRSINRAVIVGERSPGYLLIANWKKVSNGTAFMYAFAKPIMPDGNVIEGRGVVPDIEIGLDRDELLHGKDTQDDFYVIQSSKTIRPDLPIEDGDYVCLYPNW